MVRLVYEDLGPSEYLNKFSDASPLSKLLLSVSDFRFMSFSCGAPLFEHEIFSCLNKYPDSHIIGFFDAPPDNYYALKRYKDINTLLESNFGFVTIIPVICSEYFMLRSLDELGLLNLGGYFLALYDDLKTEKFDVYEKSRYKTLEKAYKAILGSVIGGCCVNKVNNVGAYYIDECPCNDKCSLINRNISVREKAYNLYSNFPCFWCFSEELRSYIESSGFLLNNVDLEEVKIAEITKIDRIRRILGRVNLPLG